MAGAEAIKAVAAMSLAVQIYKALASSSTCGRPLLLVPDGYDGIGEVVIDGYFDLSIVASQLLDTGFATAIAEVRTRDKAFP